jgi:hypothetical protein
MAKIERGRLMDLLKAALARSGAAPERAH